LVAYLFCGEITFGSEGTPFPLLLLCYQWHLHCHQIFSRLKCFFSFCILKSLRKLTNKQTPNVLFIVFVENLSLVITGIKFFWQFQGKKLKIVFVCFTQFVFAKGHLLIFAFTLICFFKINLSWLYARTFSLFLKF
jgi:hypothetical protein